MVLTVQLGGTSRCGIQVGGTQVVLNLQLGGTHVATLPWFLKGAEANTLGSFVWGSIQYSAGKNLLESRGNAAGLPALFTLTVGHLIAGPEWVTEVRKSRNKVPKRLS